jgi:hypothetical protein
MTFKRTNDKLAGRTALQLTMFNGVSYRSGLVDQDKRFHYASDLDFFNSKPKLRNGSLKTDNVGTTHSIDGLFMFNLWQKPMLANVINGIVSVANVDEVVAAETTYRTWGDVYEQFTWSDMDSRTWQQVIDKEA